MNLSARLQARPSADLAKLPIGLNLHAIDLTEGVRAALSVAVIVAANEWVQSPFVMEAALGAWLCCLCDQGGPIQRRVPPVLSCAFPGALITLLYGLAVPFGIAVALPLAALGLFLVSFARIYGQAALTVGNLLGVTLVLAMDRPVDAWDAMHAGLSYLGGGLWAALLTLVLWRVYPFLPARRAVAGVFSALSLLVDDMRQRVGHPNQGARTWEEHARAQRRTVRETIESARNLLLDTMRVRGQSGARAAQNLIRVETADQIFGALIALGDLLEQGAEPDDARRATGVLDELSQLLRVLAEAVIADRLEGSATINRAIADIAAEAARLPVEHPARPAIDAIAQRLKILVTVSVPEGYHADGGHPESAAGHALPLRQRLLGPVRANLNWNSLALRHALRVVCVALPPVAAGLVWPDTYLRWLTITLMLVLQPYFAMTWTRALERVGGTILGGLIAAGIGVICTTPIAVAAALFPVAVAALAVRRVSYGLFITAVTPMVVLLSELGHPGTDEWTVAAIRAGFTVLGGLIAVAGAFSLWPSWEPVRLRREVSAAISAHAAYADAELGFLLGEADEAAADQARRGAGVASNNLEASLSRALLEPGQRDRLEAAMVIDAALRRLAGRLAAMQLDPGLRAHVPPAALRAWRAWIAAAMASLTAGGTAGLPARPPFPPGEEPEGLGRISRQVELMAGAIGRLPVT